MPEATKTPSYVAMRNIRIDGVSYGPGDPVDVPESRVSTLLGRCIQTPADFRKAKKASEQTVEKAAE